MCVFKAAKSLMERLRGKSKRPPKVILRQHNREVKPESPEIYTPKIEVPEPVPTAPETYPDKMILDVKNREDWEDLVGKLKNLRTFENFLWNTPLSAASVRLDRVRDVLRKITPPNDFDDEDLNFNLAKRVRDIALIMLEIVQNVNASTTINENSREALKNLVEEYLENIGVEKGDFQRGKHYDDWAALGMQNSILTISTDNYDWRDRIADVEIQPHYIYYVEDKDRVEHLVFGGLCKVYKYSG